MPDSATLQWSGMKELTATLASLSRATQDHLAFMATSGAAHNVVEYAQANVESYGLLPPGKSGKATGSLIGNFARARQSPKGLVFSYDIGVRHGTIKQKKDDDDPFYWWWLEFGTVKRPGTPFLTTAFEQSKNDSLTIMAGVLTRGIAREVAKAAA